MEPSKDTGAGMGTGRKEGHPFPCQRFHTGNEKVSADPFEQAAYAYSLIESEVDMSGTE